MFIRDPMWDALVFRALMHKGYCVFSLSLFEPGLQLKFHEVFRLKLQTEFQVVTTTEGPALLGFWDMKKKLR